MVCLMDYLGATSCRFWCRTLSGTSLGCSNIIPLWFCTSSLKYRKEGLKFRLIDIRSEREREKEVGDLCTAHYKKKRDDIITKINRKDQYVSIYNSKKKSTKRCDVVG